MSTHEEIKIWAWIVAVVASSNWVFGNRSVFGRDLTIRSSNFWRITRWLGLVVFVLGIAPLSQFGQNGFLAWASIIGAFVMLIGTARKRVRHADATHQKRDAAELPATRLQSKSK